MKYKVTVCIPVYNAELFLEECIESLTSQTMKEIELIFVNDGSTDKSLHILRQYAAIHPNMIILNQKNKGLGGARNAALKIAKGEFVGFVDADDFVDNKMYQKLYETAKMNAADIAYCNSRFYPAAIKNKKIWFNKYHGKIDASFLHKNTQPGNKIVSNSLLKRINFQFYEKNGDGQYIILMLQANHIVSISDIFYNYRVGHQSMSTNYNIDNFKISIKSCEKQIELLKYTQYKDTLKDYFKFRMIYVLLQAQIVAALYNDKACFDECSSKIKKLGYKKNINLVLLKNELGLIRYLGMVYVIPRNYMLSKNIVRILSRFSII